MLSQAAAFWASGQTRHDGTYHIVGVTGPDEENADVDDEAYTNVARQDHPRDAAAAARVLGTHAPAVLGAIAAGCPVLDDPARPRSRVRRLQRGDW